MAVFENFANIAKNAFTPNREFRRQSAENGNS